MTVNVLSVAERVLAEAATYRSDGPGDPDGPQGFAREVAAAFELSVESEPGVTDIVLEVISARLDELGFRVHPLDLENVAYMAKHVTYDELVALAYGLLPGA